MHDIPSNYSDEQDSDAISFGGCPYIYYNSSILYQGYIALPPNIPDLNNVFSAPLNRRGLLCMDCIDGFGPSVVTIGYACANCTENNHGWMLYILSELIPATDFYFVVLTFQICITSAPMNCFVIFSQIVVFANPMFEAALKAELDRTSHAVLKVILTGYGFWNLAFFSLFHSTILCEPKPQEYPRLCPPVCVCLLPTTAHCSYIHLC